MASQFSHLSRVVASAGAAAALALLTAATVVADDQYPPSLPTAASGVCEGDIPYFSFQVDFGSAEFVGRPMRITFVNPNGEDAVIESVVPSPTESQRVLWPGAAEEPNPDWPGWELDGSGTWVPTTTDVGAFTRVEGGVTVEFAVNPTLTTSVTYPPASAQCAGPQKTPTTEVTSTDTSTTTSSEGSLASTGANNATAAAAFGMVLVGAGAVLLSRRRSRNR